MSDFPKSMTKRFRWSAWLGAILLLLALTGCGSDRKASPTAPPAPEPASSAGASAARTGSVPGASSMPWMTARSSAASGGAIERVHHDEDDSDLDSDEDSDLDSDEDSDLDSDEDSDEDSDLDSDEDSDLDSDEDSDGDGSGNDGGDDNSSNRSGRGGNDQATPGSTVGFRGEASQVRPAAGSIELADGSLIQVGASTRWDRRGDAFSLDEVRAALRRGARVRVRGEGTLDASGAIEAARLRVDLRGRDRDRRQDDDERPGLGNQFEGRVGSVSLPGSSLTLAGGQTILVGPDTAWSARGDLFSLAATAAAVTRGAVVRAEGRGERLASGVIAASTLKVEVDD